MSSHAHIELPGGDLFFTGPFLEQGISPALAPVDHEAMEGAVPYAHSVGLVPADEGSRLPAGAVKDIELFRGDSPLLIRMPYQDRNYYRSISFL